VGIDISGMRTSIFLILVRAVARDNTLYSRLRRSVLGYQTVSDNCNTIQIKPCYCECYPGLRTDIGCSGWRGRRFLYTNERNIEKDTQA